jgi:hypothetical protein
MPDTITTTTTTVTRKIRVPKPKPRLVKRVRKVVLRTRTVKGGKRLVKRHAGAVGTQSVRTLPADVVEIRPSTTRVRELPAPHAQGLPGETVRELPAPRIITVPGRTVKVRSTRSV